MDDSFEKFSLHFSNLSTAILLNILHLKQSLIFFSQCIASLWRYSTSVGYYIKFSFHLKKTLFFAKDNFIHKINKIK